MKHPVSEEMHAFAGQDAIYSRLDPNKRQIRLAYILPGDSDPISISLNIVSFDDIPIYEALSYCWGDPRLTKSVLLNGKWKEIATNLADAVKEFQRQAKKEVTVLWIDALCIYQDDREERSQQVLIMPMTYRSAQRVRAWLGPRSTGYNKE